MTLYVGNIDFRVTSEDLAQIFAEFGTVKSAKIIMDRDSGRSKGFAFVEMSSKAEGENAISQMNGASVEQRTLKVNEAMQRVTNSSFGFQKR